MVTVTSVVILLAVFAGLTVIVDVYPDMRLCREGKVLTHAQLLKQADTSDCVRFEPAREQRPEGMP